MNRFGNLRMNIHICWRLCPVINCMFPLHQEDILLLQPHLWRDAFNEYRQLLKWGQLTARWRVPMRGDYSADALQICLYCNNSARVTNCQPFCDSTWTYWPCYVHIQFFYQNVIGYQRKLFECFQVTIITGLNVIVNEKKQATLMGNV